VNRVLRRLPEHLRNNRQRVRDLRSMANGYAGHYGVPVWLCGSALMDVNSQPRDWDIRVDLPEEDFLRLYGDPVLWEEEGKTGHWTSVRWQWSGDCVKQSKWGHAKTRLNIDFQVYPADYARRIYGTRPRYRLDSTRAR
jgi:hypothetical protein